MLLAVARGRRRAAAAAPLVTPAQKKAARGDPPRAACAPTSASSPATCSRAAARPPAATGWPRPTSRRRWRRSGLEPRRPGRDAGSSRSTSWASRATAPRRVRVTRGGEEASTCASTRTTSRSPACRPPEARLDDAEIVFVGYGIVAPEYQWDDYKGADLKGKVLAGDEQRPRGRPRALRGQDAPLLRPLGLQVRAWRRGWARRARSSSTPTPSAGYQWQVVQTSWYRRAVRAARTRASPQLPVQAWATEEACAAASRSSAGRTSTRCARPPQKRDFKPVPLGVTAEPRPAERGAAQADRERDRPAARAATPRSRGRPSSTPRTTTTSACKADAKPGEDAIYNGALDNASGVAALLAIAEAMTALPAAAAAHASYFAAVAAEEQGLLGSQYLAAHPPCPRAASPPTSTSTASTSGAARRTSTMIGLGKSSLDDCDPGPGRRAGPRRWCPTSSPTGASSTAPTSSTSPRSACPPPTSTRAPTSIGKPRGLGQGAAGRVRGEGLPPALGRAARRLGLLGRRRGRPALLLPGRSKVAERAAHAGLEAGRRVRGGAQEGAGGGQPAAR